MSLCDKPFDPIDVLELLDDDEPIIALYNEDDAECVGIVLRLNSVSDLLLITKSECNSFRARFMNTMMDIHKEIEREDEVDLLIEIEDYLNSIVMIEICLN